MAYRLDSLKMTAHNQTLHDMGWFLFLPKVLGDGLYGYLWYPTEAYVFHSRGVPARTLEQLQYYPKLSKQVKLHFN
jgi:hypothetical protein